MPDDSYNYIAHYMDHWSKFHIMWPLMRKSAVEVAVGLATKVFPYLGLPKILQSDNGREFVYEIVKETLALWIWTDIMARSNCGNKWASLPFSISRIGGKG